ncbi:RCC1 domain containing protein [Toxoplasma gondii ME49]|uniref:RCC1 domain containing protein n=1 Tax=Toxoplasma gondii (strain ATCC 50611 / Me49) TaxID=508771 RepID=S8G708_TOXGM|nr:RCC1 domain containing protein [Toxoplasma gondii ME49]EPT27505.1 RCC1 domain containing protein [Toxoplasma gondii ME49]|eukprot:XP_018636197.1 RCC1 domain containing protein [Toxoplasma gondii ME49]
MAFEEAHVSARSGLNNRSAASLVRSDTYEEPELVLNQLATSQQSRCCVGSVFILAKETDGSFREVPGLSGQHLSFISGGYDKVLVALSSPAGTGDCQSHQHSHATQWVSGSGKQCLEELETTGSGPSAHMGRSKGHSGVCTKNEVDLRSSDAGPCRQSPEVPTHPTGQSKWPLDRIRGTEVHYAETHNRRHWICHACSSVPNRINRFYPSQWPRVFCRRDGGSKRRGVLRDSCFEDIFSSGTADSPFASEEITWACPGPSHFLILTSSGRLYSSGYSAFGCVGRGGVSGGNIPLAVPTLQDFCVTQACVGKSFSLALTAQGEVYSWGGGFQGQLGRVPEEVSLVPRFLQRLMQIPIKTLACNESHVLAVTREGGQCFGWGSNDCGQLGLGRRCPAQPIPQLVEIKKQRTACFFKDRQSLPSQTTDMLGNVLSVEQRGKDRMEDGPSRAFSYGEKDSVVVSEVAAGWRHSLALTVDGDVYAWGLNICGQLGLGHRRRTDTPTLVPEYEPQIRCMRSSQTLSSPSCLHRGRPSNLLSCTCRPLSSPSHQNTHSAQAIGSPNPSSFGAVSPCCAPTCCLSPSLCRASDAFACLGSNCKGPHSKHFPGSDCEQTATGGSRPATRNLGITSLREIWRLGDGTERGGKQQLRPRVRQICVGRLFSGFLLDDGRVLVSGRFPSGREEATRENLSRGILCVTEKSKREVEACLTPSEELALSASWID